MVDDCCANNAFFGKVGSFGSAFFDGKRFVFMIVATALSFLSWILTIVTMAGHSVDNDTVMNCAWTVQEYKDHDVYYGTYRYVVDPTSATIPNMNYKDCSESTCNDCETAGETGNNCSIVTFIMLFFFIALSVARMKPEWDKVVFKCTFVIMSLVNILVMIIGMGAWDDQCADKHIQNGEVFIGPGLNCYITTFFFMLFAFFIHLMTPVATEGSTQEALTGGDEDTYKPYEESFVNDK